MHLLVLDTFFYPNPWPTYHAPFAARRSRLFCAPLDEDLDKGLGRPFSCYGMSSRELRHGRPTHGLGRKKTREGVTQCNPPKVKC